MPRLPIEKLPARLAPLDLSGTEVSHLPDWGGYDDPKRLDVIRHIALMRGRDPRIANLAVDIIKKAGVQPRDYKGQAAALLAWVQNPKNVYYINEAGERLQDPIYTIKQGYGDCDDQVLVLCALFESCRLPWKLVIAGVTNSTRKRVRFIEGNRFPGGVTWNHIYCMVGVPPFNPHEWYYCETTIEGVPLGWDIVEGDKSYLPEMDKSFGLSKIMGIGKAPRGWKKGRLPREQNRSPAYDLAYGQVSALSPIGAAVGVSLAAEAADDVTGAKWFDMKKIVPAVVTGVTVSVATQLLLDYLRASKKTPAAGGT